MGVLDKIKNALFEVEYVEVEEPPKKEKKVKEKKVKEKRFKDKNEEKPIAKKIVLPGKREEKIEEIEEEELKDEDFEIRPKDETIKAKEEFKFMDDNDFKVDDYPEEPEIVQVFDQEVKEEVKEVPVQEEKVEVKQTREERNNDQYEDYYNPPKPVYSTPHESKPYGMDNSYKLPVHEYGTYEKKEEKTYFKPSPIISPIYGILDKNYKKEDVKEKREVRITSNYTRSNVSVDDIRDKAYGDTRGFDRNVDDDVEEEVTRFELDEENNDDLLVDLSDRSKPEVKELTMGDAEEYFQDLGLEYNVDYVDVSTDKNTLKKEDDKHKVKEDTEAKEIAEEAIEEVVEDIPKLPEEEKEEVKEEVKEETTESVKDEDSDNLFDLIDSMYQDE